MSAKINILSVKTAKKKHTNTLVLNKMLITLFKAKKKKEKSRKIAILMNMLKVKNYLLFSFKKITHKLVRRFIKIYSLNKD